MIRDVTKNDQGDYVCQANNMVGTRESEPAKLEVLGNFFYIHYCKRYYIKKS